MESVDDLAQRLGITPEQVQAVLESRAADEVAPVDRIVPVDHAALADHDAAPSPATALPASAAPPVTTPAPARDGARGDETAVLGSTAGMPARLLDALSWAGAGLVLISVIVFALMSSGLSQGSEGKGATFVASVLFGALTLGLGRYAQGRGYLLGVQLAWGVAAIVLPLLLWSAAWQLGIFSAQQVPDWPAVQQASSWHDSSDWQWLLACLCAVAVGAAGVIKERSGLALGVALLAAQYAVTLVWNLADWPDISDGAGLLLTVLYTVVAGVIAGMLERRHRALATWVHPFVIIGATMAVVIVGEVVDSKASLIVGAAALLAGVVTCVLTRRVLYLTATIVLAAVWEIWLYGELDMGPVLGLVLTLALGLGGITLVLLTWKGAGWVRQVVGGSTVTDEAARED